MNKLLLLFLVLGTGLLSYGQEGVAPLWGNEWLQLSNQEASTAKALDNKTYNYLLDTNHLPIVDDFSTNLFKKYSFDSTRTDLDTLVWIRFLADGTYIFELPAMTDTSYTYPFNGTTYDSVANPPITVIFYSNTQYQVPIDTQIVWIRPDTIFVGGTVVTFHDPDITYYNYRDSVIVIPDTKYSVWRGNSALHNYTYGVDPITLGVATFDGLDSIGMPYDPTLNPNAYQIADILESKPIYLKTKPGGLGSYEFLTDTAIWLSFYYQPQGLGDAPEPGDSLILQFYSPFTDKWYSQWKAEGSAVKPFKSVSVNIRNPIFFLDGFKFRFLNYASVSGNFDHWNIDYVRLDNLRTKDDTTAIDDVALLDPGKSLLKDYSQMPWSHYKASTGNLMNDSVSIRYRNLYNANTLVSSSFDAYESGSPIFSGSLNTSPIVPSFSIVTKPSTFLNSYPITASDSVQSFHVKYWIEPGSDTNSFNDTTDFHQQFGTQYAYDDGSAESAYFVTSAGASIAVEYNLAVADTLRAINIYFPKSYENILDRSYRLTVWESLEPEKILYESYLNFPVYATSRDMVQGIVLEEPLAVSGTIYVGIKQTDQRVYIGLDKNNNNQNKNYYKVNGIWANSSYSGSLFIRPEFGSFTNPWPVSVDEFELEKIDFKVYPNPSNSVVNVVMNGENNTVVLRSILGVTLKTFSSSNNLVFDVWDLPSGIYLVEVTNNETGKTNSKKLLIQH